MQACSRWRRRVSITTVAALLSLTSLTAAGAATSVFKLADDATLVVRGTVDRVATFKDDAFVVFTIRPKEVFKGSATSDIPVALAQERVFRTERPYYEVGTETLIFAVPLPGYSYYRNALPEGSYMRWPEPKDTASDIASLADPQIATAVSRYLQLRDDPSATAIHLARLLVSTSPRLRADALTTITGRPEIASAVGSAALAPFRAAFGGEGIPATEWGAMLSALASHRAPGAVDVAIEAARKPGPLQAPGVDALVTLGRTPDDMTLLAHSRSDDAALRSAAVRGLARSSSDTAMDRAAAMVRTDPDAGVRLDAIRALGASHAAQAVAVLTEAMRGTDESVIRPAADSLAQIGSPEAVRSLASILKDGSFAAQAAATFALLAINTAESDAILREEVTGHPDARVRRLIKLALGEVIDEHEE